MANRLPYLLTLLAGLLICCCFIAAKAPTAAKQYDYVTIVQEGETLSISSTPDHFEQPRTKMDQSVYRGNFSLLFTKVNAFEAQGYELVENTALTAGTSGVFCNYVMLRRPRQ